MTMRSREVAATNHLAKAAVGIDQRRDAGHPALLRGPVVKGRNGSHQSNDDCRLDNLETIGKRKPDIAFGSSPKAGWSWCAVWLSHCT
jgi:hypothetical protein